MKPLTTGLLLFALVSGAACATTSNAVPTPASPSTTPATASATVTTPPASTAPATTTAPPTAAAAPTPTASQAAAEEGPRPGSDRDHAVKRCGPNDSYYYIATLFRCADGSNPFNGDVMAGGQSRVGNAGANSSGHIIDLYEIPCPEGPRRVFVDMYGCTEH